MDPDQNEYMTDPGALLDELGAYYNGTQGSTVYFTFKGVVMHIGVDRFTPTNLINMIEHRYEYYRDSNKTI